MANCCEGYQSAKNRAGTQILHAMVCLHGDLISWSGIHLFSLYNMKNYREHVGRVFPAGHVGSTNLEHGFEDCRPGFPLITG